MRRELVEHRDTNAPAEHTGLLVQPRAEPEHAALHLLGAREHRRPLWRQLIAPGRAIEQRRTDVALERCDATSDGGVLDVELAGGTRDAPGSRNGEKDAQVVPVRGRRHPCIIA